MLLASGARRAVLGLNAISAHLEISDESVVTQVTSLDPEAVIQSLTHVVRVAARIAAERLAVPVAAPLRAHAEVLRVFANERDLGLRETPMELRGEREGVSLELWYLRTGPSELDGLQVGELARTREIAAIEDEDALWTLVEPVEDQR